jgi:hypothetical protein
MYLNSIPGNAGDRVPMITEAADHISGKPEQKI